MSGTSIKPTFWTTDRIMRLILGVVGAVLVGLLINYLSDVLVPFFVACALAYFIEPLVVMNMNWTHTKSRVPGTILALLEVGLVLGGVCYLFLPAVIKEVELLSEIIHKVSTGETPLAPEYRGVFDFIDRIFDGENLKAFLSGEHFQTILLQGSSLLEESMEVILKALSWLLTVIYVLFILIDYPQITNGFKLMFPHKIRARGVELVREVQTSMNHYFRGQGLVALCAVVLYSIGFSIVKLPLAIPMGVLVGILYMIPYFQYVTLIPVAAICFIYSLGGQAAFLPEMGKCLLVYVVAQSICDYILTPHIMGKEMGLNPAVILLSLSVWGSLLGIIGMIIALPMTALIMTYYERYISNPRPSKIKSPDNAQEL